MPYVPRAKCFIGSGGARSRGVGVGVRRSGGKLHRGRGDVAGTMAAVRRSKRTRRRRKGGRRKRYLALKMDGRICAGNFKSKGICKVSYVVVCVCVCIIVIALHFIGRQRLSINVCAGRR